MILECPIPCGLTSLLDTAEALDVREQSNNRPFDLPCLAEELVDRLENANNLEPLGLDR
jgi:hypothetical protein